MEISNPITVLGVTLSKDNLKPWNESFDEMQFDDRIRLVSKELFDQGEDEGVFNHMKYRYVILAEGPDMGFTVPDENGEEVDADYYCAYLVPSIEDVSDDKIKSLKDLYGFDDLNVGQARQVLNECDLADEGYGLFLGAVSVPAGDSWNEDILNALATATRTVDALRGFYLDRYVNGIGMTGWDMLEMCLTDKDFKDFLPA